MGAINSNISPNQTQLPLQGTDSTTDPQAALRLEKVNGTIVDTITTTDVLLTGTENLNPSQPVLPKPDRDASDIPHQPLVLPPSYNDVYSQNFSLNYQDVSAGLTDTEKNELLYVIHNPDAPGGDPSIRKLAEAFTKKMSDQLKAKFPNIPTWGSVLKKADESSKKFGQDANTAGAALDDIASKMPQGKQKEAIQALKEQLTKGNLNDLQAQLDNLAKGNPIGANIGTTPAQDSQKMLQMMKDTGVDLPGLAQKMSNQINDMLSAQDGMVPVAISSGQITNFEFSPKTGDLKVPLKDTLDQIKTLSASYDSAFEDAVGQLKESPETVAKLQMAHYFPQFADPAVSDLLQKTDASALGKFGKLLDMPPNGAKPPVDSHAFQVGISNKFNSAVEAHIATLGAKAGMTPPQIQGAVFLFNHPGAVTNPQVKSVVDAATTLTTQQMNIPQGFPIVSGQFMNDSKLQGNFVQDFQSNLRSLPLTTPQFAQIKGALADPNQMATLDPAMAKVIDSTFGQALSSVQSTFGLPANWTPNVAPATLNTYTTMFAGLDTAKDIVNQLAAQYAATHPNAQGTSYMNAIKIVSEAISELKSQISSMEVQDSQNAQVQSKAKLAMKLDEVAKQKQEMLTNRANEKKMAQLAALGPLGKVFEALMIVFTGGAMLPFLLPVLVADDIVAATNNQGQGLFQQMFNAITTGLENSIKPKSVADGIASALKFMLVTAISMTGNVMVFSKLLFSDSNCLTNFLTACGATDSAAQIANMAMGLAFQAVILAVQIILSGGGALAGVMAEMAAKVAQLLPKIVGTVSKILDKITEVAQKMMDTIVKAAEKIGPKFAKVVQGYFDTVQGATRDSAEGMSKFTKVQLVVNVAGTVAQAASSVGSIIQNVGEAQAAQQKGEMEAYVAKLEAMLQVLQNVLDKLLSGLNNDANWMKNISDSQNKYWQGLSQAATSIANAA